MRAWPVARAHVSLKIVSGNSNRFFQYRIVDRNLLQSWSHASVVDWRSSNAVML